MRCLRRRRCSGWLAALAGVASAAAMSCPADEEQVEELVLAARVRPGGDAVDLLFVIDDSSGMGNQQVDLIHSFRALADPLVRSPPGAQPVTDLHVGIIDAAAGTGGYDIPTCEEPTMGALQARGAHSGCPAELDPPYLSSNRLEPNDGGPSDPNGIDLAGEFDCTAALGDRGCGMEQPLESLRLALTDRVEDGTNEGFFRQGALLVVVIVTEEDDCSARDPSFFDPDREDLADLQVRCSVHPEQLQPVAFFADLLRAQRVAGRLLLGAWITVPLDWDGSLDELGLDPELDWRTATDRDFILCENARGTHFKAPRLAELVLLMGEDGFAWSQCEGDISDDVTALGSLVLEHLDPRACLPSEPPAGSRCEVALRLLDGAGGCPTGTVAAEPGTCELRPGQWELVETAECTELRPAGGLTVPDGAGLELQCFSR